MAKQLNPSEVAEILRRGAFDDLVGALEDEHLDWLTPAPEGLDVAWFPSAADAARGIVAITVPPQPRDRWPCIVGKVIDEGGKRRGVAVSYVERHGEHAVEWTPAEFQRLLREGARADAVANQLAALGEQMARLSEQVQRGQVPPAAPPGPSDAAQTYGVRLGMAVTAANLRGAAVYVLTAAPIETVTLPTLFRGPNEALPRLLADPPRFRGGGWDMAVRGELDVVEGRLRRGVAPGSKILECWYDGALIHAADATGYLCWGPKTRGDVRRINPLALAESTLLFAMLAEAVYANHATPRPAVVRFGRRQGLAEQSLDESPASAGGTHGRMTNVMKTLRWVLVFAFYLVADLSSPVMLTPLFDGEVEESIHRAGHRRDGLVVRVRDQSVAATTSAALARRAPTPTAPRAETHYSGVRKLPAPDPDSASSPEDH